MKKLLQAFGLFGMVVFAVLCLWEAFAQPTSSQRLRDLQDVRLAPTVTSGHVLNWNGSRWTNGVASGGGGGTNYFNGTGVPSPNFQNTSETTWNISGTNITLTIIIGVTETNYILNFYSVTNTFHVGKGGTVIISTNLTLIPAGPSKLLRTDANTNVVATTIGSGLAFDGTTLSATGGGGGPSTHVTTLGWSGTNLTGFNCATNGESFYVLATNNAHFGTSTFSNLQNKDAYMTYTLCVQQDSTGGRIISGCES